MPFLPALTTYVLIERIGIVGAPISTVACYLLAAAMLIIDGGLGLVKVALLRFLKIHILKNTTTPIHDHVRKRKGWSNAQVVFRFAIIQIVISAAAIYWIMM